MKKLSLILPLLFPVIVDAQRVEITGFQSRQFEQDALLECSGVKFIHTMVIDSVDCDCDGFWIMKGAHGDKPVKAFWTKKHVKNSVGYELPPNKYFVYPNLTENSDSARVTIWLIPKRR